MIYFLFILFQQLVVSNFWDWKQWSDASSWTFRKESGLLHSSAPYYSFMAAWNYYNLIQNSSFYALAHLQICFQLKPIPVFFYSIMPFVTAHLSLLYGFEVKNNLILSERCFFFILISNVKLAFLLLQSLYLSFINSYYVLDFYNQQTWIHNFLTRKMPI